MTCAFIAASAGGSGALTRALSSAVVSAGALASCANTAGGAMISEKASVECNRRNLDKVSNFRLNQRGGEA